MKTIVYGITSSTALFVNSSHNKGEVVYACTKGGERFGSHEAISLNEIEEIGVGKFDRVVICSEFVSAITKSLLEIGFDIHRIYFFDHHRKELLPYSECQIESVSQEEILYAFYDLSSNLVCFDVVTFAVLSELYRQENGFKYIQFIVVPDRSTSTTHMGARLFHDEGDYQWRVDHVIKPSFSLVPTTIGISQLPYREAIELSSIPLKQRYPARYDLENNVETLNGVQLKKYIAKEMDLAVLKAPSIARELIDRFIEDKDAQHKKIITVTLRESKHQDCRNSDLLEWKKFLDTLDKSEYFPVLIRDTYRCGERLPEALSDYQDCAIASVDFAVRVALYERAYVNMGISTGPIHAVTFLPNASSIVFQKISEDNPSNTRETLEKHGLFEGEDYFYRTNNTQKLHWGPDNFDNLCSSFENMLSLKAQVRHENRLTDTQSSEGLENA